MPGIDCLLSQTPSQLQGDGTPSGGGRCVPNLAAGELEVTAVRGDARVVIGSRITGILIDSLLTHSWKGLNIDLILD